MKAVARRDGISRVRGFDSGQVHGEAVRAGRRPARPTVTAKRPGHAFSAKERSAPSAHVASTDRRSNRRDAALSE
jgi:hypothetical protein